MLGNIQGDGPELDALCRTSGQTPEAMMRGARRRYPHLPLNEQPVLPELWAGFRTKALGVIDGDGPELDALCLASGATPDELMRGALRPYRDLALYPLEWVSHHWRQFVAVFADLERFPRRQVFSLDDPASSLAGYHGANEFDFLSDRFGLLRPAASHERRRRGPALLAAG